MDPAMFKDFMSYCDPTWVSDYTWLAMWNHMRSSNLSADVHIPADAHIGLYERVLLSPDGSLRWLQPLDLKMPPMAQKTTVTATTAAGEIELEGHFYPYDHMEGGMLLFPKKAVVTAVKFQRASQSYALAR
jgi:hypothetical protein